MDKRLREMFRAFSASTDEVDRISELLDKEFEALDKEIAQMWRNALLMLDTFEGDFVSGQDMTAVVNYINQEYGDILNRSSYRDIMSSLFSQKDTLSGLHFQYNLFSPNTGQVFDVFTDNAKSIIEQGNSMWSKTPIIQSITRGMIAGSSIERVRKDIDKWIDGQAGTVQAVQVRKWKSYAGQIARDSIYQARGAINDLVKEAIPTDAFMYIGGKVKDSRPLCRHMVDTKVVWKYTEMPKLIGKYPEGLYPGTNKDNFIQVRGGYNCLHEAIPINSEIYNS